MKVITTIILLGLCISNIVLANTILKATPNDSVCINGEIKLTIANSAHKQATDYSLYWGDGTESSDTSNLTHNFETAGIYTASLVSNSTVVTTIKITVLNNPLTPHFPSDTSFCTGERTLISAENPGAHYNWSTGQTSQKIQISKPGIYSVDISYAGCSLSKSINVWKTQDDNFVNIPTAFTPNMDGKNDEFKAVALDPVEDFHLLVFSKWGELMFESYDINIGWDGTYKDGGRVPNEVYIVLTEYKTHCARRVTPHTSSVFVTR